VKRYTDGEDSWVQINVSEPSTNPDLIGPLNQTLTLTHQDVGLYQNDQVVWEFMFIAEDTDFYTVNSSRVNFTIEKDDVNIYYVFGNGEQVWRNGTDSVNLILGVNDSDRNVSAVGANVTFYITTNSSDPDSFDSGTTADTYSNGSAIFPFSSGCAYSTGVQTWYGETSPDTYYKTNVSPNYSLTIKTVLLLEVNYPDGQAFVIGTLVPFIGRVFDECNYNVSGADVLFYDKFGESQYSCVPVTNQGNGTYNCTFNTAGKPFTWQDVQIRGRKQYYGNYPEYNITTKFSALFLASEPSLSGLDVNPDYDGWGQLYTFDVLLTDQDKNYNNVTLWKSFNGTNWTFVDNKTVKPLYSSYPVSFQKRFTCEDYLNATNGINYYKIRSEDEYGFFRETPVLNWTLEADDVTVAISSASNSTVRRIANDSAYLVFTIRDDDYASTYTNGTNGTIWITLDGENYTNSITCNSSIGNCSVNYNPNCSSSVGTHYWLGGTTDVCYKYENTSNTTLTVYGQLNISLLTPDDGTIINRDRNVSLNSSVTNDCTQDVLDANVNWYNSSGYLLTSGYNTTWYVPLDYKLGSETIYSNVTRQYYDYNSNNTNVYVYGWSDVQSILPLNNTTRSSGDLINVICRIIDGNSSNPIPNYTVYFYKNNVSLGNNTTNSSGYANVTWDSSGEYAGWYNISCYIYDNSTLYYNVSQNYRQTWVGITRPLLIDQINMNGNPCSDGISCGWIYRNNSYTPNKINISVHAKDANIGNGDGANITFYNATTFLYNCTTNSSGWCDFLNYNPSDLAIPNNTIIYINGTRPENEDSDTEEAILTVKGLLNVTIISPPDYTNCGGTGTNCPKSNGINLTADVYSENGENVSYLSPTVTWYNESNSLITGVSTVLPAYKVAEQATGTHDFMAVASKSYYDSGSSNFSLNITGIVSVFWIEPIVQTQYPDTFYPTCFVEDDDSGMGVSEYGVNFSYMWYDIPSNASSNNQFFIWKLFGKLFYFF